MILTISVHLRLLGYGMGPNDHWSSRERARTKNVPRIAVPFHGPLVDGFILGMVDDDSVLGGFSSQNINISSH